MTHLALVLGLFALAGVLNAVMDTLHHHWGGSVFARWSRGEKTAYWGSANHVWLRRYVGRDPRQGYVPAFRLAVLRPALEAVWDGWHLCKTLMWLAVSLAVVLALGLPWWGLALGFFAVTIPFSVAYELLRP